REFQPDLIHLNDYSQANLDWERPVIVVGHSCVCSWFDHVRGHAPGPEWNTYRQRVREGLQAAHLVVAPTRAMLEELHRCYGPLPATRVIDNGRELSGGGGTDVRKEPFILSAGRVWDDAKNISLLA